MNKYILVLLCFLLSGCSIYRVTNIGLTAKGAKKLDSRLENGDVVYKSETIVTFFGKVTR